jgi:tRNA(Arg) A34 adenosine deaminase TadA
MREAIELARDGVRKGLGGPFGAVVVKNGQIIGRGQNRVTSSNDPTAHAEIVAIRDACRRLGSFRLEDGEIYTSCEPCPMCLAAIHWARLGRIIYGADRRDAAAIGFDDEMLYEEIGRPHGERRVRTQQFLRDLALEPMQDWESFEGRVDY